MDFVTLIKFVSLLLYPLGLALLLFGLGGVLYALKRARLAKASWLISVLIVWLASTPIVAIWMVGQLEQQYPPREVSRFEPHDAIVVLGGGLRLPADPVKRIQFTHATDRYWLASELYKAEVAPKIVLLGGNVFAREGVAAESVYAKALLVEWGVPDSAIETETQSRTTEQNFEGLKSGWLTDSGQVPKWILVTSALHMPRAMYLAERVLGGDVQISAASADVLIRREPLPAFKYWIPDAGALHLSTVATHEVYGLWFELLKATF